MPFVLLSLVVVGALVLALASAQVLVTQRSLRVADLEREVERIEESFDRLRLEAAELSSYEHLERAARRAGLVYPEDLELLVVRPDEEGREGRDRDRGGPPRGTLALEEALGGGR